MVNRWVVGLSYHIGCSRAFWHRGGGKYGNAIAFAGFARPFSLEPIHSCLAPRIGNALGVLAAVLAVVGKGGGTDSGKNGVTKPTDPAQTPAKRTDGVN